MHTVSERVLIGLISGHIPGLHIPGHSPKWPLYTNTHTNKFLQIRRVFRFECYSIQNSDAHACHINVMSRISPHMFFSVLTFECAAVVHRPQHTCSPLLLVVSLLCFNYLLCTTKTHPTQPPTRSHHADFLLSHKTNYKRSKQ